MGGSVYCEAARQIALKARGGAKRPKKVTGYQPNEKTKGSSVMKYILDLCKEWESLLKCLLFLFNSVQN